MSQRNSSSNKAVKEAWTHEQALVAKGKGTRDWTPEQQADILTKGKAFDDNGRAFHGHHMQNVKDHPEYQGKWENIQFLSFKEHLDAHNKNFRNKTNGQYDYKTGKTKDFGNKNYSRPDEIVLSNRVSTKELEAAKSKMNAEKIRNKSVTAGKFNAAQDKSSPGKASAAKFNSTSSKISAARSSSASHGGAKGTSHGGAKGSGHGR